MIFRREMFLVRAGTVVLSNSYFIILVLLLLVYSLQVKNDTELENRKEKEKKALEKPEEKQFATVSVLWHALFVCH